MRRKRRHNNSPYADSPSHSHPGAPAHSVAQPEPRLRCGRRLPRQHHSRGDNLGGWFLPTPAPTKGVFQEKFPVGFTLVLDVTGRDAQGRETNGIKGDGSGIEWLLDPPSLVEFSGDPAGPFQHKYRLLQPGTLKVYVGFDGVGSNDLRFEIVPCTPPDWGCRPPP